MSIPICSICYNNLHCFHFINLLYFYFCKFYYFFVFFWFFDRILFLFNLINCCLYSYSYALLSKVFCNLYNYSLYITYMCNDLPIEKVLRSEQCYIERYANECRLWYYDLCNVIIQFARNLDVLVVSAFVSALLWSFGSLILADCWLHNSPGFGATMPIAISNIAAIVLNSVHPKVMREAAGVGKEFALLLAATYSCMFLPFAQMIWWSVDNHASLNTSHACVDATGYCALFITISATLIRFSTLVPNFDIATRTAHTQCGEWFDYVAPVCISLCTVSSILCYSLATIGAFGGYSASLALIPMMFFLPTVLILHSTKVFITDMESPVHLWFEFARTCSVPWAFFWPIVLLRSHLLDTLQTLLVCLGNGCMVILVGILMSLAHTGSQQPVNMTFQY
jgi:hypothetical protein